MKDLLLFFFLAALVALLWRDCRRAARASGDERLIRDIQVMEPLSKEQMDELDRYVLMEELAEDPGLREEGFRELELYSYWRWREGKRAA